MSDDSFRKFIISLDIIAKIPQDGQLSISGSDIDIYPGGIIAWISRKTSGDGKEKTLAWLIRFYDNIKTFVDKEVKHIEKKCGDAMELKNLLNAVKGSKVGLNNLATTYNSYVKVSTSINCINRDTVSAIIKTIEDAIQTSIPDQHPEPE